jgi:delta(3,5)-delta(2,4)-dienoyl-CoA isomerase
LDITADVGVLQRFPKIVGNDSLARELAFTGRKLYADEAKELGLVRLVWLFCRLESGTGP